MSRQSLGLPSDLYNYYLKHTLRESPVLRQLRRETAFLRGAEMQIAPEQGQFMALLVRLIAAKKAIEIGTYTGYSTLAVAEALPVDGRIVTCDTDQAMGEVAKQFWAQAGVSHKIELKIGPALASLDALLQLGESDTFDFAFIDADKTNNDHYYERCLKLVRRGGLIAIDNIFRNGQVCDPEIRTESIEASREFNRKIHQDLRVILSVVPIADGLALAIKR